MFFIIKRKISGKKKEIGTSVLRARALQSRMNFDAVIFLTQQQGAISR